MVGALEALAIEHELLGLKRVQLVFPAGWKAPPGFPRRELACVNAAGERVAWVSTARLLAWCRAEGPGC